MNREKTVTYIPLIIACFVVLALGLPTVANNIDKPNMIPYFNSDDGGFMDLIWYHYSGEKRASFQWDAD